MKKEAFVVLNTCLQKFVAHAEKSGWTYVAVPATLTQKLLPGNKKMFRVKGQIDAHKISGVFLLPMGDGNFILPVNATMRKGIHKKVGAMVELVLQLDLQKYELNKELMACLEEEKEALAFFRSLAPSHQNYFSKWVDAAKTDETKIKRIARALHALQHQWDYGQMSRFYKGQ